MGAQGSRPAHGGTAGTGSVGGARTAAAVAVPRSHAILAYAEHVVTLPPPPPGPRYEPEQDTRPRTTVERRPQSVSRQRTFVHLSRRQIVELAPGLGDLPHVQLLDLSHNQLASIDLPSHGLRALRYLLLGDNRLTKLPDALCTRLTGLTTLDLNNNRLNALPDSIGCLTALTKLNLSHNHLTSLPRTVGKLASLQLLRVDHNELAELPVELARLRRLHTLTASHNRFLTRQQVQALMLQQQPEPAVPPLRELVARCCVAVVREHQGPWFNVGGLASTLAALANIDELPEELVQFLASHRICSHCGGPFFGAPVRRYRFAKRGNLVVPFVHELCAPHWHTDQDRIRSTFLPPPTAISPPGAAEAARVVERHHRRRTLHLRAQPQLPAVDQTSPPQNAAAAAVEQAHAAATSGATTAVAASSPIPTPAPPLRLAMAAPSLASSPSTSTASMLSHSTGTLTTSPVAKVTHRLGSTGTGATSRAAVADWPHPPVGTTTMDLSVH